MRTALPFLLIVCLAAPAGAATRNFGITSFEKIRVEGPFKVRLATGVAPSASASGSQSALDAVAIDVQGNTLVVHASQSSWGANPGQNSGPVEIRLGTHDLGSARLNGSGTLQIDKVKALTFDLIVQGSGTASIDKADIDQLTVGLAGSASATVGGRTGKLNAVLRGISSLDAGSLLAKDAAIAVDGAATIKANISNSVKIDGSGPATVALAGSPACISKLGGSATVTGCR